MYHLTQPLKQRAERYGTVPALRYRRFGVYHEISWHDYWLLARACAASLIEAGIEPGDRVAVLADNRMEWLLADMGLLAAGAVNVPPHAALSAQQIEHQLRDAEVRWVFLSPCDQWHKIAPLRDRLPNLMGMVAFDPGPWLEHQGVHSWTGFVQHGLHALAKHDREIERRARDENALATIMYTSGTTGRPKGVMLTHANLLGNAVAIQEMASRGPQHRMLSWLPYSHIYARTVDHYLSLVSGVAVTIADSADTVVEQLQEIRPTHFSAVPRFYEKVLAWAKQGNRNERLRAVFGNRIEWLTSGGAPLPPAIAEEFRDAGLLVLQGYGLTETSPVISFNRHEQYKLSSVGIPIPGVRVRIAPDGEIVTAGPHVMRGYWKQPEATAEIVQEGWLHTGDLGRMDEDGYLYVTGRKKEMMVLSNGKKVMPPHLEGLLVADELVDQALVCGEGKHFLSALIVPNWCKVHAELGIGSGDPQVLAHDPRVRALIRKRVDAVLQSEAQWEQVREIVIVPEPFSIAREELTVSLKMRRDVILRNHADRLNNIYGSGG